MHQLIDLASYPIDRPASADYAVLVRQCREELFATGMFNLCAFVRPDVAAQVVKEIKPAMATAAFTHKRCRRQWQLSKL